MTNDEFRQALKFIAKVIDMAADPDAMVRLGMLKAEADGTLEWLRQFDPVEGYENEAKKGTCPTCGGKYTFAGDLGGLRRHKRQGRCALDVQMAAEIVPAVLLIAELSDSEEGAESDDGVHETNSNHV